MSPTSSPFQTASVLPAGLEAYDSLPLGVFLFEQESRADGQTFRLSGFNRAASRMTGMDLRSSLGKRPDEAFPRLSAVDWATHFGLILDSGKIERFGDIRHGDQKMPYGVFSAYAYPLPERRIGVIVENITDGWNARQKISDDKRFLEQIIDTVPDPIFVKDRQHRMQIANEACCRLIGRPRDQILGKTDHELFSKEEADVFVEKDERVFFTQRGNENQETMTGADGQPRTILTKKMLYADHAGKPFIVGLIRDITEQKRAAETLKELNVTLEAKVRERTAAYDIQTQELARSNAELERFAYVASHDLQEPLRTVGSYVQLLARRYGGKMGKDADEFIGYVVDGVSRMKKLISDLLDYSRLGRKPKAVKATSAQQVLKEVLDTLKASVDETGAVVTWTELPIVYSDSLHLAQLFQNLIGNALKFRSNRTPRIHLAAQKQDAVWVFSVSDNGIGLNPRYRDQIFDVFQRLHSSDQYPGTGIGLAVCKKIVEQHGGRIWVEGAPGEGCTFFFTMPCVPEERQ